MEVCQVGSSLHDWGGIERYLVYLNSALSQRSHDVTSVVPFGSPLDQRTAGTKAHISLKRQYQVSLLPTYLKFFRSRRFDVVNTHFSPDYVIPAIAAKVAKQPCRILTRHVVVPWKPSKVKRYASLFTHFLGVSNTVGRMLMECGLPESRVLVAEPGCPPLAPTLSRDESRQQLGISDFAAGFFGRMVADKGVSMLLEAGPRLLNATIHAFGDGPLRGASGEGVTFHGRVTEVDNAVSAVDSVVIPSMWEEAFGFSAIEAMSLGKPIIATKSGNLAELVIPGLNGLLVEKADSIGLAHCINALACDPEQVAQLGRAGMEIQRTRFLVEHFGERVETAYAKALG